MFQYTHRPAELHARFLTLDRGPIPALLLTDIGRQGQDSHDFLLAMANNVILSLHLSYSENTISNLNPNHLYRHVLKTTQQLGIPSPARAHVKKVDAGTVFVEHLSFLPSVRSNIVAFRLAANRSPLLPGT